MNDSNLTLKIKKSDNFEDILKKQNIRIIKKDKIIFEYSYKMEL
jgi:hypothetical protein